MLAPSQHAVQRVEEPRHVLRAVVHMRGHAQARAAHGHVHPVLRIPQLGHQVRAPLLAAGPADAIGRSVAKAVVEAISNRDSGG